MPSFQDFYFQSSTGRTSIHALKCVPDSKPRAVVQIAHGIAEHIDRYRPFMEFLADNGFVVAGNDHLGHGKSIRVPEEQGFFAEKDGWWRVVDDMDKLHDIMSNEYPELPYVLFGHSMGSFLTRTYLIKHPDKYDGVILSGTGHQSQSNFVRGFSILLRYVPKASESSFAPSPIAPLSFAMTEAAAFPPRTSAGL